MMMSTKECPSAYICSLSDWLDKTSTVHVSVSVLHFQTISKKR